MIEPNIIVTGLFVFVIHLFVTLLLQGGQQQTLIGDSSSARNVPILQDHPNCGTTTGGREECWWNCSIISLGFGVNLFKVICSNKRNWEGIPSKIRVRDPDGYHSKFCNSNDDEHHGQIPFNCRKPCNCKL